VFTELFNDPDDRELMCLLCDLFMGCMRGTTTRQDEEELEWFGMDVAVPKAVLFLQRHGAILDYEEIASVMYMLKWSQAYINTSFSMSQVPLFAGLAQRCHLDVDTFEVLSEVIFQSGLADYDLHVIFLPFLSEMAEVSVNDWAGNGLSEIVCGFLSPRVQQDTAFSDAFHATSPVVMSKTILDEWNIPELLNLPFEWEGLGLQYPRVVESLLDLNQRRECHNPAILIALMMDRDMCGERFDWNHLQNMMYPVMTLIEQDSELLPRAMWALVRFIEECIDSSDVDQLDYTFVGVLETIDEYVKRSEVLRSPNLWIPSTDTVDCLFQFCAMCTEFDGQDFEQGASLIMKLALRSEETNAYAQAFIWSAHPCPEKLYTAWALQSAQLVRRLGVRAPIRKLPKELLKMVFFN
jgi:hypothetical protein